MKIFKRRKGSKNSFFDMKNRVFITLKKLLQDVTPAEETRVLIIDHKGYDITGEVLSARK